MIRRLRRRMILLVLAGLLLASAGLVGAINWMNWNNLNTQASTVLHMLAENGGKRPVFQLGDGISGPRNTPMESPPAKPENSPPPEPGDKQPPEPVNGQQPPPEPDSRGRERDTPAMMNAASLSNYYTITLDEAGEVLSWSSDRADLYTDEDIADLAASVLREGKTSGRLGTQFYRLLDRDAETGEQMLIAVDSRLEIQNVENVFRVTALVAVAEDALLSLAAVWLIYRLVKPVDEAMEKQKQFVWDASHELKTPLAVISANAEALAAEVGESKSLGYIQSEVRRTDKLIQNLLTLARMEKGTVQAAHQRFDLSRALLEVALPFESAVFETGKELTMDIQDGVTCVGDVDMVKQLIVILLSNAQKYSDDGGKIGVTLETRGDKRILKVHNTGPAIPAEAQARIFDRFYRADSSHNREIEGNGLGLAIAQSIVDAHKGKITVHSAENEGTTFTVIL
ncbi:MAG: hypothetical protein IJS41_12340 [Clostridia bacterium]|nr:hypothetical protein [Clostridia bacterium]